MINGKIIAINEVLEKHGIQVNNDIAVEILNVISTRRESEYEIGDFVIINDGMGEYSFGEIIQVLPDHYEAKIWDEYDEVFTYISQVYNDISRLSSKEEAKRYAIARARIS